MRKLLDKLFEAIGAWVFRPPKSKQTYSCSDRAKREQEQEQKEKKGGWIY